MDISRLMASQQVNYGFWNAVPCKEVLSSNDKLRLSRITSSKAVKGFIQSCQLAPGTRKNNHLGDRSIPLCLISNRGWDGIENGQLLVTARTRSMALGTTLPGGYRRSTKLPYDSFVDQLLLS